MKTVKLQGAYKTKAQALKAVTECINTYYSLPNNSKRNDWRIKDNIENAKRQINETGEFRIKGAQWGGKWGNYYRMIALNSKGVYQYVEGFNPHKSLL